MSKPRFIVAGNFIDGNGDVVRRNVYLAVVNGYIQSIGSATDLTSNDNDAIDDLSHCTILPALVDCSVSLLRSPAVDTKMRLSPENTNSAKIASLLYKHMSYCHAHGVLGVAENHHVADQLKQFQKNMVNNSIITILTPFPLLPHTNQFSESKLKAGDFIRIPYTCNIEEEKPVSLVNYSDLHRCLIHKGNRKAIVVANGQQQIDEAINAGCDAIEQGYGMNKDTLKTMVDKDVLWIPSVLRAKNALDGASSGGDVCCRFSTRYVAPGKPAPGAEAFWKKMLSDQLSQLQIARELGVRTAVGTGAGSIGILHGESMSEEIKLFIKAGYTLAEAIRCGSENGARFFGLKDSGALNVGRKATFLLTRGTAQQLPRKLSYLEGIYINGKPSTSYSKTLQ